MVDVTAGNSRYSLGLSILMPVLAGTLIGIAGFLVKVALAKVSLTTSGLSSLVYEPLVYIAAVLGIVGFLLFQKALHGGKVSIVPSIMNGLSISVPIILAMGFLGENLTVFKATGIVLVLVGIAGLREKV